MTTAHQPIRVFVSYSQKDWRHRDRLRTSLRGLRRQGLIEDWQDQDITPGNEWAEAIDENLKAADVIILLVSPDFVDSDYAYYKEMQRALERHERGEAVVIPVIVRPTDWEEEPFSKLEALPTKGRPIIKWSVRDDAWLDVSRGIRKAVKELSTERRERAAKERYHKAAEEIWADNKVSDAEAERLGALASELALSADTAANIEREVMGETKDAILERQEQVAREKEQKERLDKLYAQARRLHQDQEWQAVIDIFEQVRAEDPNYSDPEGLLETATEALRTQDELSASSSKTSQGYREAVKERGHTFITEDQHRKPVRERGHTFITKDQDRKPVKEDCLTVIYGWSREVFLVVAELFKANESRRRACIAILAEKDKVEMEDEIRARVGRTGNMRVVCRTGDPINIDDVEIVNPNGARSIVVLPPEGENADSRVIKTMLAITNNPNRREEPYHIVSRIGNPENLGVAQMVGGDEVELVPVDDLIARITAQTCRQSGLSVVYTDLLDFGGVRFTLSANPVSPA